MVKSFAPVAIAILAAAPTVAAFVSHQRLALSAAPSNPNAFFTASTSSLAPSVLYSTPEPIDVKSEDVTDELTLTGDVPVELTLTGDVAEELTEEKEAELGNLVADEEWAGLSMELAEIVRTAVVEDIKKNSRDFLGSEEYAMGDFSKEIDRRVKDEISNIRGKEDYELGDFSVVLDESVKSMVCELTGNDEYQFGDLSTEIDARTKESVAKFCGKENYEFGDLSKEIASRTKTGVLKYTGRDDYVFGDLTTQALKNFTGKDEYQFGDVSKKLFSMFGGNKKGKNF